MAKWSLITEKQCFFKQCLLALFATSTAFTMAHDSSHTFWKLFIPLILLTTNLCDQINYELISDITQMTMDQIKILSCFQNGHGMPQPWVHISWYVKFYSHIFKYLIAIDKIRLQCDEITTDPRGCLQQVHAIAIAFEIVASTIYVNKSHYRFCHGCQVYTAKLIDPFRPLHFFQRFVNRNTLMENFPLI